MLETVLPAEHGTTTAFVPEISAPGNIDKARSESLPDWA
jgi:hypothetical protein